MWTGSLMNGLKKTRAAPGTKRPASDPRARSKTMQVHLLKSKIHRAQVTGASANYEGSLKMDSRLTPTASRSTVQPAPPRSILGLRAAFSPSLDHYAIHRR